MQKNGPVSLDFGREHDFSVSEKKCGDPNAGIWQWRWRWQCHVSSSGNAYDDAYGDGHGNGSGSAGDDAYDDEDADVDAYDDADWKTGRLDTGYQVYSFLII